ncbi:MAG TPA: alkaline phosphatase family protein, partial [Actinomycetota bacterium]|nr:alkaline phosphatase family protein [Actinomycetota bacterium]
MKKAAISFIAVVAVLVSVAVVFFVLPGSDDGSSPGLPTGGPSGRTRSRQEVPIRHVIYIIKENRTFDNYFGSYPGADGATSGKLSNGDTIQLAPAPDVYKHDLGHEFTDALTAIDGGRMDAFDRIPLYGETLDGYTTFSRDGIPAYWAYADHFVLGDRMFSSMYGPTFPEHLYTFAGTGGRVTSNKLSVGKYAKELNGRTGSYCSDPGERVQRFRALTPAERDRVMKAEETGDISTVKDFWDPAPACFDFDVLPDLLDEKGVSWRYYANPNDWRNALHAIKHIRFSPAWRNNIASESQSIGDIEHGRL